MDLRHILKSSEHLLTIQIPTAKQNDNHRSALFNFHWNKTAFIFRRLRRGSTVQDSPQETSRGHQERKFRSLAFIFILPVFPSSCVSLLLELSRPERTTDRARMIFRTIFLSFHFGATTAQPQTTRRTGPGCPSESCIPRPRVFQWYFFVHCTFIVWYLWSFDVDVRSAAHYVALQQIHV